MPTEATQLEGDAWWQAHPLAAYFDPAKYRTHGQLLCLFNAVAGSGKPKRLSIRSEEAAIIARALQLTLDT